MGISQADGFGDFKEVEMAGCSSWLFVREEDMAETSGLGPVAARSKEGVI